MNWMGYDWEVNDGTLNYSNLWMWHSEDMVCVDNDHIMLSAVHDPKQIIDWQGNIYNPKVAVGTIKSLDYFGYGTFSSEIQLPKGKHLWPAFWLVGDEWPRDGEIDICEAWTPYFRLFTWRTAHDIHYWDDGHQHTGSHNTPIIFSPCPTSNFVRYEVEWRKDIIVFRVNGHTVRTYGYHIAKRLHDKRMRVIFDLWTTGEDFRLDSPMIIRNFEYKPIEIL